MSQSAQADFVAVGPQMLYDIGTYGLAMVGRNLLLRRPNQCGKEAYSAVYTRPPLAEPLEILGRPRAVLWIDTAPP